ncbi:hypothetical protein BDW62DRAFT_180041 [Aspergillus aurantiobrunneus]
METLEILRGVRPLVGEVTPIKTVQETRPVEEYDDAYVAGVNVKSASKVVKVLDAAFPRDLTRPMNHLRRFAKKTNLPEPLQPILLQDNPSAQTIFVLIAPPLPDVSRLKELLAPYVPTPENPEAQSSDPASQVQLHTIKVPTLAPLSTAQAEKWTRELWPIVYNPAAARATISPPLQVLHCTRDFIQPDAGRYLAFARKVGEEAEQSGRGRGVGAVVVDPLIVSKILDTEDNLDSRWADAIVAVAGDARYSRQEAGLPSTAELHTGGGPNPASETYNPDLEGGPDLHALMRAAEIIAYKRRAGDPSAENDKPSLSPLESYFLSQMDFTASEPNPESEEAQDTSAVPEKYQKTGHDRSQAIPSSAPAEGDIPGSRIRPRAQGGYLCTDLDIYLTHEPCLCCSMGLLLSRFRAIVFPQRGRMVMGGLASEPVGAPVPVSDAAAEHEGDGGNTHEQEEAKHNRLYYGLHWRKELNWRALGFEFVEDGGSGDGALAENGVTFHA